ncbi:hypothetical protein GOP47_0024296 [Adiantum capillus-veneris]|uniref:tRNA-uridine aminocarboxypropyltransferase n=1 Tax=Adiantum capillus-veneris TaxID=13818 RepID=A0A9D4Z4W4_ADICA|nr:hypothetical protein GOP47_0024296 [Adiantum capillus-veneris]
MRVCLCAELPSPPLPTTRTTVVVLQHPHEARHKLSTLPLLAKCIANCHILHGRRFHAGASPLLDFFSSHHPSPFFQALLLFPTPSAQPISSWYDHVMHPSQDFGASPDPGHAVAATCLPTCNIEPSAAECSTDISMPICTSCHALAHRRPDPSNTQVACCKETSDFTFSQRGRSVACDAHACSQQEGTCFPHILLIAVDATWQHANEMIKGLPSLGHPLTYSPASTRFSNIFSSVSCSHRPHVNYKQ